MHSAIMLMSEKRGEIQDFLKFCGERCDFDDIFTVEWKYIFRDEELFHQKLEKFCENIEKFSLSLWISAGDSDIIEISDRKKQEVS